MTDVYFDYTKMRQDYVMDDSKELGKQPDGLLKRLLKLSNQIVASHK